MVVLDQHIKFLEGNYSVTIAVSWERQTWGHYGAVNGEGRKRREPKQFSNSEYYTTHNYGLVGEQMDGSGTGWVHVRMCVYVCAYVCLRLVSASCPTSCVSDYYTAIISGLSLSLSLNPSSIHRSCSLVRGSALNKAHSHAERMWGSTEWFQLTPQLHTTSPSLSLPPFFILSLDAFLPQTSLLCFSTLCIMCPCRPLYTYLCHTQFVSLLWYPIRALCLLLHPEAVGLNWFFFFFARKRKTFLVL